MICATMVTCVFVVTRALVTSGEGVPFLTPIKLVTGDEIRHFSGVVGKNNEFGMKNGLGGPVLCRNNAVCQNWARPSVQPQNSR